MAIEIILLIFTFIFIFLLKDYIKVRIKIKRIKEDGIEKVNKEINELNKKRDKINLKRKELEEQLEITIENQKRITDLEVEKQANEQMARAQELFDLRLEELENNYKNIFDDLINKLEEKEGTLKSVKADLDKYKGMRKSINDSILLEKKKDMERNFHKIILNDTSKEDITFLLEIEDKINNKEVLRKLIYETYIRGPLLEMEKRVLENKEFSGIYKITNIDTGECYIGKAVNIKQRWQAHCKESLGIGRISHSLIHDALKSKGWDNFTFEVLEKCGRDVLNEREKYYIDFYETTKFGYNMKAGG